MTLPESTHSNNSLFKKVVIPFGHDLYPDCIQLRDLVLRKPLGLQFYVDDLANEFDQVHLGITFQDQLVACLLMKPISKDTIKMRQVAVHPNFQKQGIGTDLCEYSEKWAKDHDFASIVLHARETAVPFYLKNQYSKIGEPFLEINLSHSKMYKNL